MREHFMCPQTFGLVTSAHSQNGFTVLLSVLIVGSLATFAIISMTFLGADAIQSAQAKQHGLEARQFAESCAEIALEKMRSGSCYIIGTPAFQTFQNGSCSYTITTLGNSYEIAGVGYAGAHQKKFLIQVSQTSPSLVITSWFEST